MRAAVGHGRLREQTTGVDVSIVRMYVVKWFALNELPDDRVLVHMVLANFCR